MASNYTVYATGLSALWCPSDGGISRSFDAGTYYDPPLHIVVRYTSYAGCTGTVVPRGRRSGAACTTRRKRRRVLAIQGNSERGVQLQRPDVPAGHAPRRHEPDAPLRRRANGQLPPGVTAPPITAGGLLDAVASDSLFTTLYPIDLVRMIPQTSDEFSDSYAESV